MGNPKVFVSYSWDSAEHMEWVASLVNELRKKGINADFDRNITQQGTVNLNRMMVENFRTSDFIVVVLTENYAKRANEHAGGVGLETTFLENELLSNTKKIIPIKKSKGADSEVIPYCLKGLVYIDFSNDDEFDEKLNELLYKIYGINQIELAPIGERPNLTPRKIDDMGSNKVEHSYSDLIPNLKTVTDLDKKKYMKSSFETIKKGLLEVCEKTKQVNSNFEFVFVESGDQDYNITFYLNGMEKTAIRVWLNNMFSFSTDSINVSYGNISYGNNSCNEMIMCDCDNNQLSLKMTMSFSANRCNSIEDIIRELWKNVCVYLR